MELTNEFRVNVPIERAWTVLTDVERIAPCLPGAQLEEIEGDEYRGNVKIKVGPITAQYKGKATFLERDAVSHKAVLRGEGRDTKGQGNAAAIITAQLTSEGDSTTFVRVITDLTITGRVAQFGRGVLADVSSKLLGQFVQCLEHDILTQPEETLSAVAAASAATASVSAVAAASVAATAAVGSSAPPPPPPPPPPYGGSTAVVADASPVPTGAAATVIDHVAAMPASPVAQATIAAPEAATPITTAAVTTTTPAPPAPTASAPTASATTASAPTASATTASATTASAVPATFDTSIGSSATAAAERVASVVGETTTSASVAAPAVATPAPAPAAPQVRKINSVAKEPVDLVGAVSTPVLKRLAPAGAVLLVLLWLLRRRRS